jgi:hypothetical protein
LSESGGVVKMTIKELTPEQLHQVKETYLIQKRDEVNEPCYMSELIDVNEIISNKEIYQAYSDVDFVEADFF